ncbi:MAG: hypothetical protein K6U04_13075 [Armatimonadetes bacterium]|nr:hypothetical protein [Armatimonadota bacterium]
MVEFTWQVYEEYVIEEEKVLEPWVIVPEDIEEYYRSEMFFRGEGKAREYRPDEHPSLYVEFQRVRDREDVLRFIREYGLLSGPRDSLTGILTQAKNVRECLRLYDALQNGFPLWGIELEELAMKDGAIAHEKLGRFNKEKVLNMGIEKWTQIVLLTMKGAEDHRTPQQGREALIEHVNKRLEGVRPILAYGKEGFTFSQTCNSLLQFIYLQIFEHITGRREFVRCLVCGSYFVPVKKGQKICSPLPGEYKSKCRNRYDVANHRGRKSGK